MNIAFVKRLAARRSMVAAVAVATGVSVLLASQVGLYPTPIISDEVKYLLAAKYMSSGGVGGGFDEAMRGYSLLLRLLAVPFGGVDTFSASAFYRFSVWINIGFSAVSVLLAYFVTRSVGLGTLSAILSSLALGTLPLFFADVPFAWTEIVFAAVSLGYAVCVVLFVEAESFTSINRRTAALLLVASFWLIAIKAVGLYFALATCLWAVFVVSDRRVVMALFAITAVSYVLVAALDLRHSYGNSEVRILAAAASGRFWWLTLLAALTSLIMAALSAIPLIEIRSGAARGVQPPRKSVRAAHLMTLSLIAFLLPAIAISAMFHAYIGRLTNYRTVASVVPLLVLGSLCYFGAVAQTTTTPVAKARSMRVRLSAVIGIVVFLLAARNFQSVFVVDNFFDFLTLPFLYHYMHGAAGDRVWLEIAGFFALTALAAQCGRFDLRVGGLVLVNLFVIWDFTISTWYVDQDSKAVYRANMEMFEALAAGNPSAVTLAEYEPDLQWPHFAWPWIWTLRAKVHVARFAENAEGIQANGLLVIRHPVLNAEPLLTVPAAGQAFFAYDLDRLVSRDSGPLLVDDLAVSSNLVSATLADDSGHSRLAWLKANSMFGPLILMGGSRQTITIISPAVGESTQYQRCALHMADLHWPITVSSAPRPESTDLTLRAEITAVQTMVGMVRLQCAATSQGVNGDGITLPISSVQVQNTRLD